MLVKLLMNLCKRRNDMRSISLWKDNRTNAFEDFFGEFFVKPYTNTITAYQPNTNVTTTDKGYEVSLAVPGVSKEDINVNVANNTMTVSYNTKSGTENTLATKSFTKSWSLPENTDPEFITAKSENGILTLSVPTNQTINTQRTITVQ